jgi:hypothetical protein
MSQGHAVALNLVKRDLAGPWLWGLKIDAKTGAKTWKWNGRVRASRRRVSALWLVVGCGL